eukprot:m.104991 g.104991  ORF g.104991 m.104991 type:complete len:209 (+) comp8906_c0_seq3:42-668(+)
MPPRESAKSRKAEKERGEREREERAKEDAKWVDNDKNVERKAARQEDKQRKQQEAVNRKAENKALAEAEADDAASSKKGKAATKVSRMSIAGAQEAERLRISRLSELKLADRPGAVVRQDLLQENPNIAMAALMNAEGAAEARNVEDAISLLSQQGTPIKPMNFETFKRERLPIVQQANPQLRMTQAMEQVFKDWERSPQNPANRARP